MVYEERVAHLLNSMYMSREGREKGVAVLVLAPLRDRTAERSDTERTLHSVKFTPHELSGLELSDVLGIR